MKIIISLIFMALSFGVLNAQHTIDILDVACSSSLFNLTQKLMTTNSTFTFQDTAILLFSGKRPFDLGSQQMCDLTPGMAYKVVVPEGVPSQIGVCIYDYCRAVFLNQAEQVLLPILEQLVPDLAQTKIQFYDEQDTQIMQDRQHTGFTLVTHLLYLLIAICLIGVAVEYSKCLDKSSEQLELARVPQQPKKRTDKELLKSKTKWGLFFLSFSFTRNIRKLTTVGTGGEGFDMNLEVFAGVRTMSMMYVILGHVGQNFMSGINMADIYLEFTSLFATFVQGGFYAVDAFFCMAGFLGTYVFLVKLEKSKGKINIPLAYFHRWYRLAPALALLILLFQYVVPFVVHGPLAVSFTVLLPNCEKYWWTDLLFINNLYPGEMSKQCVGWVWYLANDFQFFLITPFILLIMYFNKIIGFVVNVMIILLSIMASMLIMWKYNFKAPYSDPRFFDQIYIKPWTRMAAYMVGVLLAQLYYDRKLALKGDARGFNTIGNCCFSCYKKSAIFSIISVLVGAGLTSFIIFIYGTCTNLKYGWWSLGVSMVFPSIGRPLFVLGMMLVLMPTFQGRFSWLFAFMSNPLFVVLGRLTYCAYLMHFTVIYSYKFSLDSTSYFTETSVVYHYIGIYVMSYAVAFGVSLIIEAPLLTIEKTLMFPPKPPKKKQEDKTAPSQITLRSERENEYPAKYMTNPRLINTEVSVSGNQSLKIREKQLF